MEKMSYFDQLKNPKWQKKRLEMLEAANWECTECGSKDGTLHVHHKQYIKGRMAWEYSNDELMVVCEDCHDHQHQIGSELKELLALTDNAQALGLLRGFHLANEKIDTWVGYSGTDADPSSTRAGFVAALTYGLRRDQCYQLRDFLWQLLDEDSEEREQLKAHAYVFQEL